MGLVKITSYEDYWTTDNILEMPGLRSTMTRNRFELILTYLHLNNNANCLPSDNPSYDRLFKVRPVLTHLNTTWKTAYHPNCEVSVYLLEVCVVNAGVIHRQLHPAVKFDPTKFRMNIVRGLLAGYERPVTRVGRKMSQPPPGRLVERHFLTNVSVTTSSGKPSRPDCEV